MSACVHFDSYLRFRICYCVVCKFSKFSLQQHLSYLFGMIKYATTDCRWCRHWCTLISIYPNQYKTVCFVKKTNLVRQFRWDITWVNSRTQTHAVEVIKESFVVFDLVNRHHAQVKVEWWNLKQKDDAHIYCLSCKCISFTTRTLFEVQSLVTSVQLSAESTFVKEKFIFLSSFYESLTHTFPRERKNWRWINRRRGLWRCEKPKWVELSSQLSSLCLGTVRTDWENLVFHPYVLPYHAHNANHCKWWKKCGAVNELNVTEHVHDSSQKYCVIQFFRSTCSCQKQLQQSEILETKQIWAMLGKDTTPTHEP